MLIHEFTRMINFTVWSTKVSRKQFRTMHGATNERLMQPLKRLTRAMKDR